MTHVRQTANNSNNFDPSSRLTDANHVLKDDEILDADYEVIEKKSDPNKKRKMVAKVLSGLAIGGGLAGGTLAFILKGDKDKTVEQPTTSNSETATKTEVVLAASPEIGSMEISPELTDEQIVDQIVANFNKVMTMRLVPETYDAYVYDGEHSASVDMDVWAKDCVEKDIRTFFVDNFGKDFESDETLKASFDSLVNSAGAILSEYLLTVSSNIARPGEKAANLPTLQVSVSKDSYTKANGYINITMIENTNYWETALGKSSTADPATSPDDFTLVMNLGLDSKGNYITTTDSDGNKIIQFSSISVEQID